MSNYSMRFEDLSLIPYHPDVNRGPVVLALSWTTVSLATMFVALRLYVRCKKRANGWDDYLIYIALPISVCGSILDIVRVRYGFGRHIEYILPSMKGAIMYTLICEILNAGTTFLIKVSVCLFVQRIIEQTHPKVRVALWLTVTILFAATLSTCVVLCTECRPMKRIWNHELPGTCFSLTSITPILKTLSALGALTDFACVIIPTCIIGGLQLNRRTKRAIIVVLMLGFLTAACGIGKTATADLATPDPTYDYVPYTVWSLFEKNLGFMVACMPILRPLFASMMKTGSDRSWFPLSWSRKTQDGNVPGTFVRQLDMYEKFDFGHGQSASMINITSMIQSRNSKQTA